MKTTLIARLAPIAAALLASSSAGAAGFQLLEQNGSGVGNAFAGSAAVAENASTIYFNPAGMTRLSGDRQVSLGLDIVRIGFEFKDEGSVPPALTAPSASTGGDAGGMNYIPNGYFAIKLTPQLSFGLGFGAPFGLKTEYSDDFMGRFLAINSDIKTYNINPSVAYQVNEQFSVGFGLNYQKMEAELSNAVNFSGLLAQAGVGVFPGLEGVGTVTADDFSWGWNAGLMFEPSATTRVGVSYRSKIKHDLTGTISFERPDSGNALLNGAMAAGAPNGPGYAEVELPDTLIISAYQQLNDKWTMLGDLSWTGWSSMQSLDIFRSNGTKLSTETLKWRDTWRIALGSNYQYSDKVKVKFGVAYDQSPVETEHRLARLPDANRIWLSLGSQYQVSPAMVIDVGYAHLFISDPKIDANGDNTAAKGNLVGSYNASVDILGVQMTYNF
ncbi:MAG: outer membrane protein transport protein [Rhodocyclaceae bacterium]|nr:outer membrane protein transport protein [Rhodocyclaceae bacterium]